MKFNRNARILKSQLDAAPVASVFFAMILMLLLASMVYTPGVALHLPAADGLPGTDKPTVAVAIDARGQLYFQNQPVDEKVLEKKLRAFVANSAEPLALVVQADKSVSYEMLMRLTMIAKHAGILEAWLATVPSALPPQR